MHTDWVYLSLVISLKFPVLSKFQKKYYGLQVSSIKLLLLYKLL